MLRRTADLPRLSALLGDLENQQVAVEVVVVHPTTFPGAVPVGAQTLAVEPAQLARGRAHGLAAATGRSVAFLEPGDRLLPGALDAGVAALDAHPDCSFVHGRVRRAPNGHPGNEESLLPREVHVDHYVELLRGNVIGPSCAAVFRRSALLDAGVPDAGPDELGDYALYLRLARTSPAHFHATLVAESGRSDEHLGALATLRAQRRHLGHDPRCLAAYRSGVARLVTSAGIRLGNEVRASRRGPRRVLRPAVRLARLLGANPRSIPSLLRSELFPFVARRRPGSRTLRLLTEQGSSAAAHPARAVAEAVRHTVPPGAAVLVLGRPDPALVLEDRKVRFLAPSDWLAGQDGHDETFLLLPRTSSWEFDRTAGAPEELARGWTAMWSDDNCAIHRLKAADPDRPDRVLVAGYFSFEDAHATAGDLLVRDQVCEWLDQAGRPYDVAHATPFLGGVDWRTVDPGRYSHVVFACGPFSPDLPSWEVLDRFPDARSVGVNLSMLAPLDVWNPFDALIERDSSRTVRLDVAFATAQPAVPVVGVCLRPHAPGTRTADAAIRRLVDSTAMAAVAIDTRLDVLHGGSNSTGQRSAAEIESLIARMDVVVTTRLHGLVLALKNGVPVVAIDPGNEGFKIRRQAEQVGWPVVFDVDEVTDGALHEALKFCATAEARSLAADCAGRARDAGEQVRRLLMAELATGPDDPRLSAGVR